MEKKKAGQSRSIKLPETNPLDYPSAMSGYERDSLVAEAKLAAEKKRKTNKANGKSIPDPLSIEYNSGETDVPPVR